MKIKILNIKIGDFFKKSLCKVNFYHQSEKSKGVSDGDKKGTQEELTEKDPLKIK